MASAYKAPKSILIIGSGAFGLSTALSLTKRPEWSSTDITVLDRAPQFPAQDGSSIDSSRIVRADYADPAYAALAEAAQREWRKPGPDSIGGEGRYTESGFILAADTGPLVRETGGVTVKTGLGYCKSSYANTREIAQREGRPGSVVELKDRAAIAGAAASGAAFGDWGYLNESSGWADAEASMMWLYRKVVATGRVKFVSGTVERLETEGERVTGVRLKDGSSLNAEFVIIAAGAWTPSLIDLTGQAVATGQVLAYMDITQEEQEKLGKGPVLMSMTKGTFIIPPRNRVLKIGRHAYGYQNPVKVSTALVVPRGEEGSSAAVGDIIVSQPYTQLNDPNLWIPAEGEAGLREGLRAMIPWPALKDRPWSNSRLCWYTDTATGDFLITYHPYWDRLFIAAGGSGHAFKFLPVLGDKICDCVMGQCPVEFADKWKWRQTTNVEETVITEDGSRAGQPGLLLHQVLKKQGPKL